MRRVLFISNKNFLNKADTGGKQCSRRNYELLCKVFGKNNLTLLMLTDEYGTGYGEKVHIIETPKSNIGKYKNLLFGRDCYGRKNLKDMRNVFETLMPDIVFFDGSSFGSIAKMFSKDIPIYCFYHNIEKRYAQSRILKTSPICIIKYFSFWKNEKCITGRANQCICLNERDSLLLQKYYGRKADYLLPITFTNTVQTEKCEAVTTENSLLFVGSYFMPNVRGIIWFCEKVMPHIDRKLLIVGRGMEKLRMRLENDRVYVIGTVENPEEYYYRAAAVVMPIFEGDGMKVKTAEAMMYGKIILATDEALEGYDISGATGIFRCNSAREFIDVLKSDAMKQCDTSTRKIFLERYSTDAMEKKFAEYMGNR